MNEHIHRVIRDPKTVPVVIGVSAFAGGMAVGFLLGRRNTAVDYVDVDYPVQLELDFDVAEAFADIRETASLNIDIDADDRVDDAKIRSMSWWEQEHEVEFRDPESDEGYSRPAFVVSEDIYEKVKVVMPEPVEIDEDIVDNVRSITAERALHPSNGTGDEEDDELVVAHSIFATDDGWNYEEELKNRHPDNPYIIHKDEFYSDEMDFAQITLTYYSGDDIMADEDDSPVYNHLDVTGPLRFGHGSGDPNVVYIRNEKRRAEYEVLFDDGLYSVEVLGLEIEDNERARRVKEAPRKFRTD